MNGTMRIVLPVALCVGLAIVMGCNHKQAAMTAIATGLHHVSKGNWEKAEKWYKRAIKHQPKDPIGYTNLAFVYQKNGRFNEMEAVCKTGAQEIPGNSDIRICIGKARYFQNDLDGAKAICSEYLTIGAKECMARIHFTEREYAQAAEEFFSIYRDQREIEQLENDDVQEANSNIQNAYDAPLSVFYFAISAYAKLKAGETDQWCSDIATLCNEMNWCFGFAVADNTSELIVADKAANANWHSACK
ncbi:MAG: tetratricopeptide repeat protein [Deltaproteobacteria bacterium]|nr:tetratricopeptide repeat protein [Deltaproteobacteria bacterium]MBN2670293.1 tetratricopeptide repeat protein [Deltaproteobacteria bacterium]